MKIRILNEKKLTSKDKKQKEKYVMGMKDNIDDFKSRYGDDAESVMYATATNMAKANEEQLEEMSAAGGGAVAGPAVKKEDELTELFSSSATKGGIKLKISFGNKEHKGHVERSKFQGLKNVMESPTDAE